MTRRVAKLAAELATCNENLSAEKQGAARAHAEMLTLLASVEAAETKWKMEAVARAAEAKEHVEVVARIEREHREHTDNLRRVSENREAALLSQHEYEQRQVEIVALDQAGTSPSSASSSPPSSASSSSSSSLLDSTKSTQLVLANTEHHQGVTVGSPGHEDAKDARQQRLESMLVAVQAEVVTLEVSNDSKEKELEAVRRHASCLTVTSSWLRGSICMRHAISISRCCAAT